MMRNLLYLTMWLLLPLSGEGATVFPASSGVSCITMHESEKPQARNRSIPKIFRKHYEKLARAFPLRNNQGDGLGMAITGVSLFALTIISWVMSPYLCIFTTLPFTIVGLLLSIFGLLRARKRWYQTKTIRVLAIFGIVLNGLLLTSFIVLLFGFSS